MALRSKPRRTMAGASGTALTQRESAWTAPSPLAPASSVNIHPAVARMYESLATCPDDLLLFMHHVPYTHLLHDGKTVIQYLYDSHYDGAEAVEAYLRDWKSLKGRIDDQRYYDVLKQLQYQAGQAEVWRDAVVTWFWKTSGIADAQAEPAITPGASKPSRCNSTATSHRRSRHGNRLREDPSLSARPQNAQQAHNSKDRPAGMTSGPVFRPARGESSFGSSSTISKSMHGPPAIMSRPEN